MDATYLANITLLDPLRKEKRRKEKKKIRSESEIPPPIIEEPYVSFRPSQSAFHVVAATKSHG